MNEKLLYEVSVVTQETQKDWNAIMNVSNQVTPFMYDDYLDAIGYETKKYIVYRKEKPYLGLCVPIERKTGLSNMVPYAPYQGLMYTHNEDCYSDYHNNIYATECLLDYIYEKDYLEKITIANSYSVSDIRPFLWHHYHEPHKGLYDIIIRYTAIKNLNEKSKISKRRKRELKKNIDSFEIYQSVNVGSFMDLYERTFFRQGIKLDVEDLNIVERIVNTTLLGNYGELWYINVDNVVTNGRLELYDNNSSAYNIFNVNHPDYRDDGTSVKLLDYIWEHILEKGYKYYDFVGINSPLRGDYKTSFETLIKPYYVCSLKRN